MLTVAVVACLSALDLGFTIETYLYFESYFILKIGIQKPLEVDLLS